ncbi:hypothetical protein QUF58_03220 [Anaerolineales bacterium HSG24]|nr:hypothetical protein [Anaerolineales bacterium HSG24]
MAKPELDYQGIFVAVLELLKEQNESITGLTQNYILEQLQKQYFVSWEYLYDALRHMVKDGKLEERPHPNRKGAKVYNIPGRGIFQIDIFDMIRTRDDIEEDIQSESDLWMADEKSREQVTLSVLQQIATGHALEEDYAQRIKNIASKIADENPIKLIIEAAEWVVNDLNSLADKMRETLKNDPQDAQAVSRQLGFRSAKAIRFFQKLWRLDKGSSKSPAIFYIPSVKQMEIGQKARLNRDKAVERLKERVFGDKFIDVFQIPENTHKAAIGTDASVGDIYVEHRAGSFIPPTPASLLVGAGTMRIRNNSRNYWDYDTLRDVNKYSELDAAQKGLLISPAFRDETITDFRHLRSAAMELRQYEQELRILADKHDWRPVGNVPDLKYPPETTLLIRDGRIFPLVHRLTDYEGSSAPDDVLYGQIVQNEVKTFRRVFHETAGMGMGSAVYSGAVKRPEFSWLSMLVFWYLHVKEKQDDLAEAFYRPPLNDQAVTHLLFWGLSEAKPKQVFSHPRNMLRTFSAVRRFSDIAFTSHPRVLVDSDGKQIGVIDENSQKDWYKYIKQHIAKAQKRFDDHERGIPPLDISEYRDFQHLCHCSAVAMFYSSPTRLYKATIDHNSHFLSPRWEVAIDLSRGNVLESLNHKIDSLSMWIADEDGLVHDEEHAIGGHDEPVQGLPLIIPDVVQEAHNMAMFMRDEHSEHVTDELYQLIRDIKEGKATFLK